MTLLTVELICLLFAAWKAPGWVKEIGLLGLATGVFYHFVGLYQMNGVIQSIGDISPALIAGGAQVASITTMYGILIYAVSLVIRMVQKPRIG